MYFEAGYAMGQGKQVIFTASEEELEKAHIYIEQLHKYINELKEQNEKTETRLQLIESTLSKQDF